MARAGETIGNRIAPPRFVLFGTLLIGGFVLWRAAYPAASWQDALIIAFDLAAALFLLSLAPLMKGFAVTDMRRHADENDANRTLILLVATILAAVVMAAISGELWAARAGNPHAMALLMATLALAWLFANAVYALHYAHLYYCGCDEGRSHHGGIEFPGAGAPDYRDFAYFAFTLGMTFQTSDVPITSPRIRHLALVHSLGAFAFNIGVIAFVINALG
ncbi:DUF1345 domain-containing protein [Novosphingobium sp. NPDC080210]|uniref:DUF1345 domain-containing protein n=1 Tax=Novosphingobium sp. NPDC080210 TaxID=3390596 RepID=UPI003D06DC21